ncbi:ATP-binding protein [Nocardiopsis changdeensis]|uniref:ATP-binding protein n=1 Tax=Nocardiopsis changdeensis TaxID=2831969 RepID=A0ABX8BM36_9ACTN|nr:MULTISPECIES: ATP-binding protein [Nocardiopsis]QUX23236.1 ATP-binding protein [Nocardiopsis changdeensis]QYX39178.1 ATP-binding protein [Nocardiopsis sp. MT53]
MTPARLWTHRLYPGDLARLSQVRRDLRADLSGFDPDTADTLVLCGSELFANCVKYTASGRDGGVIRTLWSADDRSLTLGFTDDGLGGGVPVIPRARTSDEWDRAEGQRGLLMVEELSTAWGYSPVCPFGDLGTHTWATFTLAR